MKRPVWHVEIVRDTNAPQSVVLAHLMDGARWGLWHPRHRQAEPQVTVDGLTTIVTVAHPARLGVQEWETFRLEPREDRLLLTYRSRFKGWPVLLLMGWWRLASRSIWERFIQHLT